MGSTQQLSMKSEIEDIMLVSGFEFEKDPPVPISLKRRVSVAPISTIGGVLNWSYFLNSKPETHNLRFHVRMVP
jgi:hypothetical protein